jgi:hypothetical protein
MKEVEKSKVIAKKRRELYQQSTRYKTAVTSDINRLKIDLGRIGKNFLIIGGSLYAAYKLSKLFTSSDEADESPNHAAVTSTRKASPMVLKIREQITIFLLALAFKKLKEFVQEKSNEDNEKGDSPESD